jgi:hypothetical protein
MKRSAESRRWARGVLLWALAVVALGQLGLAVVLECCRPNLCDFPFAYRADRPLRRLRQAPERPITVVAIGSSRTMFGLDGQRAEARLRRHLSGNPVVFNFGIPATGPVRHALHLNRLLRDGLHPDVVLIEILPYTLHSDTGQPYDLPRIAGYSLRLCDVELLHQSGVLPWSLCRRFWRNWLMPCYARRMGLARSALPELLPATPDGEEYLQAMDDSGWIPPDTISPPRPEEKPRRLERLRQRHAPALQNYRVCPAVARVLEGMVAQCRRQHIQPVLLVMPEGPLYRAFYSAESRRRLDSFLADFSHRLDVPLIDAHEWLSEDAFSDSHHITTEGSAGFTDRLAEELVPVLGGRLARVAGEGFP